MTLADLIMTILITGTVGGIFFLLISVFAVQPVEELLEDIEWFKGLSYWKKFWVSWAFTILTFIVTIGVVVLFCFLMGMADKVVLW